MSAVVRTIIISRSIEQRNSYGLIGNSRVAAYIAAADLKIKGIFTACFRAPVEFIC